MELIETLESKIAAMCKTDLREGQTHLKPLIELLKTIDKSALSKKDKIRLKADVASMLGDCNFWIAWFDLAGKDQKAKYYTKARYWYETAYYMLDYVGWVPTLSEHLSEIGLTLDPIEQRKLKEKRSVIEDDLTGYFIGNGFMPVIQIENRLKALPKDDHNHRALLLLKKADCIYEQKLHAHHCHRRPSPLSSDVMAYKLCKQILKMQDDGIDLWPGIIHRTIIFIMLRYPEMDYSKMDATNKYKEMEERYGEFRCLLERGLANAEDMNETFQKQIIGAFAFAVHSLEFITDSPQLVLR